MERGYSSYELSELHSVLLDILKEIIRVCNLLNIHFFVTGGTAIGVKYYEGFVPCDDDIDLGMTRDDYNIFINHAPKLIQQGFFVQCFKTEPDTPFFFTKVRKDNTLFVQETYKEMDIHHGIFIDIFPFDRVPDNSTIARIHRRVVRYLEGSFKRRQVKQSVIESQEKISRIFLRPIASFRFFLLGLIPKRFFYWRLCKVSQAFNKKKTKYWDVIKTSVDRLPEDSIIHLSLERFEGLEVNTPGDLDSYLHFHYPDLTSRDQIPILWKSHAPYILSFKQE